MAPVDLRLLARQRAQSQEGFSRRARAHGGDEVAEVVRVAAVAALADHGEQPRSAQARVAVQRLQDERPVRIDAAGPQGRGLRWLAGVREHAPHGAVVHVQLTGDGAHAPVLGLVQVTIAARTSVEMTKGTPFVGGGRSREPASAACRAAGSPGEPTAAAVRCSGRNAGRSAPCGRRPPRSPAGRLARVLPVEQPGAAPSYPDASRSCRRRRPRRLRRRARAAPRAPAARTSRVGQAAGAAVLVAAAGSAECLLTRRARVCAAAVALAAVATAAQQHLGAATRADEQTGGMLEQLPGSSGEELPRHASGSGAASVTGNSRPTLHAASRCLTAV